MASIFKNVQFLGEEATTDIKTTNDEKDLYDDIPGVTPPSDEDINVELEGGYCIKNCSTFLNENMILECGGNVDLIRESLLLEGAKVDFTIKNFLKEGEDYKGLKKELKEIIKANDLSEKDLISKGKGLMHVCKRILQICSDLSIFVVAGAGGGAIGSAIGVTMMLPAVGIPMLVGAILSLVIGFIINRLFRFAWDSIEFGTIQNDAESIVEDLKKAAKETKNDKLKKKYTAEAEKLEKAIAKYSAKNKKAMEENK